MAENPKFLFLCLVFGTRTKPHPYANGGAQGSHVPSITMTPDPQESQGFRSSVLGMGVGEKTRHLPYHSLQRESLENYKEKNIWSLTKEAAVRVGTDSEK